MVVARASEAFTLALEHGPRAVLLAREAKNRGALQKKGDLRPFIAFLRKQRLRTAVEIGTWHGGTLWLWCQLASKLVVSIDLPGGPFGGGYDNIQAEQFRGFARNGQELVLIQSDSHSPETLNDLVVRLDGNPIDLLFIDGDHTYDGVRQDFEMYSPLVGKGGVIAFHDIVPHTVDEGCRVDVYWRELKRNHDYLEFVDPAPYVRQWGGIGAIVT